MLNIAYITDGNYVLPTKASINSVIRSVSGTDFSVSIHIIAVDVPEKKQEELRKLSSGNVTVRLLNCGNKLKDVGLDHFYVSKAALLKFQLPEIFPELDRLLYIDGDIILYPSFVKIFDFDIADKYAAVVQDMFATIYGFAGKLGHPKYFNSGMMYLNLKRMRDAHITEKLIEYKRNDTDKSFMDQNALNAIIGNESLYISPAYNLLATCTEAQVESHYKDGKPLSRMAEFFGISEEEMRSAIDRPAILHVTGETKAWRNIRADRTDDWIPYAAQDDTLRVAKEYCVSLAKEEAGHISALQEKLAAQESRIAGLEQTVASQSQLISEQGERIADLSQRLSEQDRELGELRGLIMNTRHRTLFGAAEWLAGKIRRRGKDD